MKPRVALVADFDAILELNEESVRFLSPLDRSRLAHLDSVAALNQVLELDGRVQAFVLAFREGADYDSINYRWFFDRYPSFLYVDRVVVASKAQGKGIGRVLYEAVFGHAKAQGVPLVTCEFDVDPPNEVSERFHARFGFKEVGRQQVANGTKWVSLQAATVT
jgi:predicted GNAT superfamily acetyltransferase